MGNPFLNAIDKQDTLISLIEDYYTESINSQAADAGDGTVTFNVISHNFVDEDRVAIAGVTNADDYNATFDIKVLTETTIKVTLVYNADADFTNATITSIHVFNNMEVQLDKDEYCAIVLDIDDTNIQPNASLLYIPKETYYPLMIINRVGNFPSGKNIQIRACRRYISVKLKEILELLNCKVVGNIGRIDTVWSGTKVCVIATTLEF